MTKEMIEQLLSVKKGAESSNPFDPEAFLVTRLRCLVTLMDGSSHR